MTRSRYRSRLLSSLACAAMAVNVGCRDRRDPPPGPAQASVARPTALVPARLDLADWIRMRPHELGCWMERSFGHRDPTFGCSAPKRPAIDDPCQEGFDDGPSVPAGVARRIHPLLREVELAWEHGALQSARFEFDPGLADEELPRVLGVGQGTLDTAASAGPGACATPCYELVVFAPSDAECEEEGDDDG